MEAGASTGAVAFTAAGVSMRAADFAAVEDFAAVSPAGATEGTEAFVEAWEGTVEAGDTPGDGGTTAEAGAEAGVGADSVGPTSGLAWVTIPGSIGPDRTLAATTFPIIPTTDAIPMVHIPAIRMATAHPGATRIPTART